MSELLAKSRHGTRELSLLQHTLDVMDVAETMFGSAAEPNRVGQVWLRFFKIDPSRWSAFHANLQASAAFHDWGKANDGMQAVLNRRPGEQLIRHEHLSGLLLANDCVAGWLKPRQDIDWDIVLSAVLTHHLKAGVKELCEDAPPRGKGSQTTLHTGHPEFRDMLKVIRERLGLAETLPDFPKPALWTFKEGSKGVSIPEERQKLQDRRLRKLQEALRKPDAAPRRRMLWAVRSALIGADAAASGLPRVGEDIRPWVHAKLVDAPLCDVTFLDEIIGKRINQLKQLGKWMDWTDFQTRSDTLSDRALLLAPCGSGKTLGGWRWNLARAAQGHTFSRVIFLYPTRATAKEGFRDYVSWAPEADAALMHGTADYDLKGMFTNDDDPRFGQDYETDRRLFALRFWTRRVFSATVDQFLAFLQYSYGAICLLPILADSVLVIDEVHSFDRAMFSALKDFLKTFAVPVLCMTATLPTKRQEDLAECGLEVCDEKPGELLAIATADRYRLRRDTQEGVFRRIRNALGEGKRVLWVVNQVKRAQRGARTLASDFRAEDQEQEALHVSPEVPLFCYHSRFRLSDRVKRHNEVVTAFRDGQPPALAITTQVCEMSLDMDADLLVTEDCPITSLIQRMGRCNRSRKPRAGAGEVVVYTPLADNGKPDYAPYDKDGLTGLDEFMADLCDKPTLNQADLEEALARAPNPPLREDKASNFLESGPYALAGEDDFRDIEEFSVRAVLRCDLAEFARLQNAREPTDGLVVPVPRRRAGDSDPRLSPYLRTASHAHYHAALGFTDEPLRAEGGMV